MALLLTACSDPKRAYMEKFKADPTLYSPVKEYRLYGKAWDDCAPVDVVWSMVTSEGTPYENTVKFTVCCDPKTNGCDLKLDR